MVLELYKKYVFCMLRSILGNLCYFFFVQTDVNNGIVMEYKIGAMKDWWKRAVFTFGATEPVASTGRLGLAPEMRWQSCCQWSMSRLMATPCLFPICKQNNASISDYYSTLFRKSQSLLATYPASSAICCISPSTWCSGVLMVVVLLIALSIVLVCTSRSSNCFSNLSIIWLIFSRFIDRIADSMALVTPPIDWVIFFVVIAVCTREATASTRADIRR